ncbi:hypothetical protein ADK38_37865, partial [Streptomyces varsoviensis]
MRSARYSKVMLWRWRSNPLRRRVDAIEAWGVLAMWTLVAVGGVCVGWSSAHAVDMTTTRQRAGAHVVSVVLAEDAPTVPAMTAGKGSDGWVRARVTWAAPDGSRRVGEGWVEP